MADYPNFIKALQEFGKGQINSSLQNLKQEKKGSGDLAKSLDYEVRGNFTARPSVIFKMNKYGAFVDTGVVGTGEMFKNKRRLKKKKVLNSRWANTIFGLRKQPKFSGKFQMINTKAIDKWVIKKGLKGTRNAKGRFVTRKSLKIAIAIAIYRQGLEGTGFFSEALLMNMVSMREKVEEALAKDLENIVFPTAYFV